METKRPILTKLVEREEHLDGLDIGDKVMINFTGNQDLVGNIGAIYRGQMHGIYESFIVRINTRISGFGSRRKDLQFNDGIIVVRPSIGFFQDYIPGTPAYDEADALLKLAKL